LAVSKRIANKTSQNQGYDIILLYTV